MFVCFYLKVQKSRLISVSLSFPGANPNSATELPIRVVSPPSFQNSECLYVWPFLPKIQDRPSMSACGCSQNFKSSQRHLARLMSDWSCWNVSSTAKCLCLFLFLFLPWSLFQNRNQGQVISLCFCLEFPKSDGAVWMFGCFGPKPSKSTKIMTKRTPCLFASVREVENAWRESRCPVSVCRSPRTGLKLFHHP